MSSSACYIKVTNVRLPASLRGEVLAGMRKVPLPVLTDKDLEVWSSYLKTSRAGKAFEGGKGYLVPAGRAAKLLEAAGYAEAAAYFRIHDLLYFEEDECEVVV